MICEFLYQNDLYRKIMSLCVLYGSEVFMVLDIFLYVFLYYDPFAVMVNYFIIWFGLAASFSVSC